MARHQGNAGRTENTNRVNAVVLIEPAVFRRDKCLHHQRWDLLQGEWNTAFFTILGDKLVIGTENLHRRLQTHIFQRGDIRELRLYVFV